MYKKLAILFLIIAFVLLMAKSSYADVMFNLIAPSGELERGQDVQFLVTINTGGETISDQQIGLTFDTTYLSNPRVEAGNAMTSVTAEDIGGGKIILNGSNGGGFSGEGNFATITFTLNDTGSPGSTELCALWAVEESPTPMPTTPPAEPTSPPYNPPQPTAPPPTVPPYNPPPQQPPQDLTVRNTPPGEVLGTQTAGIVGGTLFTLGLLGVVVLKATGKI